MTMSSQNTNAASPLSPAKATRSTASTPTTTATSFHFRSIYSASSATPPSNSATKAASTTKSSATSNANSTSPKPASPTPPAARPSLILRQKITADRHLDRSAALRFLCRGGARSARRTHDLVRSALSEACHPEPPEGRRRISTSTRPRSIRRSRRTPYECAGASTFSPVSGFKKILNNIAFTNIVTNDATNVAL
jgi:hypothetical protein